MATILGSIGRCSYAAVVRPLFEANRGRKYIEIAYLAIQSSATRNGVELRDTDTIVDRQMRIQFIVTCADNGEC